MDPIEHALAKAFERFQAEDYAACAAALAPLRARARADPRVAAMAGQLALATGRAHEAVPHLVRALDAAPGHLVLRTKLGFALLSCERYDEARAIAAVDGALPLRRIVAFADQRQGRADAAIAGYRAILRELPSDHESWLNLGLLLDAQDDSSGAEDAYRRAISLAPVEAEAWRHLSRLLGAGGRRVERRDAMRDAVRQNPGNAALLSELGQAELEVNAVADAEPAFIASLAAGDAPGSAWLEYGMMLEKLNRLDDMAALVADGRRRFSRSPEIDLVEAWLLMRRGRCEEAVRMAATADAGISPIRHAHLVAQAADKMGDTDRAFAAFSEMNRLSASERTSRQAFAADFRSDVVAARDLVLDPGWPITPAGGPARHDPVFLIGFPRSGTTLLDTLLMNVPCFGILEEVPLLERLWDGLGSPARIGDLSANDIVELRNSYFGMARPLVPAGSTIVDKFPLNLVRLPLLYRMFPEARIILAERHPCDVVLSCFMSRFENNRATVHFQTLERAAGLYDLAMQAWSAARDRLPLRVHTVRYERLVADTEAELRALLGFLGQPWRAEIMDNRGSAGRRGHVATASYAQVGEAITSRAVGRWRRYRDHMSGILPTLTPWVDRMGYAM